MGQAALQDFEAVFRMTATPARSSAPRPVFGFAERIRSPCRCGWQPTQIGTVSKCADSIRRGARTVPGKERIRLPV